MYFPCCIFKKPLKGFKKFLFVGEIEIFWLLVWSLRISKYKLIKQGVFRHMAKQFLDIHQNAHCVLPTII